MVRHVKPGQIDRYTVETEWSGAGNTASYRYDMTFQAAKYKEKEPEFVESTFRMEGMRATLNGTAMPRVKLAGVFGVKIRPTGAPGGLRMHGPAATLGMPLLGWYLPEAIEPGGKFTVSEVEVEEGVTATGWGRLTSLAEGGARFSFDLGIGVAKSPAESRPIRYRGVSIVNLATGRVVSTEGEVIDPNGTMTFQVKKK
jgi:hypothetical protein